MRIQNLIGNFLTNPGAVANRTYRVRENIELPIYFLKLHLLCFFTIFLVSCRINHATFRFLSVVALIIGC